MFGTGFHLSIPAFLNGVTPALMLCYQQLLMTPCSYSPVHEPVCRFLPKFTQRIGTNHSFFCSDDTVAASQDTS